MVNTYRLVNPHIEGNFNSKIKAKNSEEAANIFYKNLSEHFNNSVPKFHFTIQKGSSGDGKYYHFEVKESRTENDVSFKVNAMKLSGEGQSMESFKSKLENFKAKFNQDGGKKHKKTRKHDSDDSDSSDWDASSDDFYRRAKQYLPVNQPIYYWWYDPYVYRLDSIYIPTFYSYVTPYIELNLKI
jgi:hypothetical protein